jgi:Tfp pilus assembly protein PilX
MKTRFLSPISAFAANSSRGRRAKGFALVISLVLMSLLVVVAVSLLTLSGLALSTSGRDADRAEARANARLALGLAIAQLQKQTGPDQRVTAPADQLAEAGDGSQSAAAEDRRHWTGVYRSWPVGVKTRPEPEFLSWLVSGEPADLQSPTAAKSGGGGESIPLVGGGTLGESASGRVNAPALRVATPSGGSARLAWWIGDQGLKAAIATPPVPAPESPAEVRAGFQTAPRNAVELAASGTTKPFAELVMDDERIPRVTGWQQAALLASDIQAPRGLFHDLAPFSTGLMTNVRAGGFRKDLSMHLERDAARAPKGELYRVGSQPGINEAELWLHYNMYKELKTRGRFTYTTGGSMPSTAPYLQVEGSMAGMLADAENFYKQPAFVSYQTILSFHARTVTVNGQARQRLALVVDPIVTYWNPLDVPVVVTPAYNSIKFWQLPYDITMRLPGKTATVSLAKLLGNGAWHYLTLIAGNQEPIVLKPGEVLMVSQGPNTPIQTYDPRLNYVNGKAGWNFGGGIAIDVKDSAGAFVEANANDTLNYQVTPNSVISDGTRHWSLNHHETYYKEDRAGRGESVGIGGVFIDYIYGQPHNESNPKPPDRRLRAANFASFFGKIRPQDTRPLVVSQLAGRKEPFMIYSYNVKTEKGSDRGGKFLSRFNPKAMLVDFYNLGEDELDVLPFEIQIQPLNSWKNRNLEVSPNGNGYFGGGMNAEFGSSFISTHSVPREPLYSLGALQHAFANGFSSNNPQAGYAVINARFPTLPQISHPIGNSLAPSVIPSSRTESSLTGPRMLADHSYLVNEALWDDWFFSGIAPQTAPAFATKRAQRVVAQEFLEGKSDLPVRRYLPALGGEDPARVLASLFSGANPSTAATQLSASLLRVDGMFNVNSTSVEAWKAMLGGLRGHPVLARDASGGEVPVDPAEEDTPVAGLLAPDVAVAEGEGSVDVKEPAQWVGRRVLSDEEIDALARALVREVRKRGPFLSLADFVNRRVGNDKDLARSGAVQSALDSPEVTINAAYTSGDRSVPDSVGGRFPFPEAEAGAAAQGIPGIVKQADILTPIAPVLSARSDSFIIRAYGESVDKNGKVLARAWCEAVVERDKQFVDANDPPDRALGGLKSDANKRFGRRYQVASFRWLHPDEV